MSQVKIENPTRTKKWGWGWNASVESGSSGWRIPSPVAPDYTGTIRQVLGAIEQDRTYHSLLSGGTYLSTAWFYDGKRVVNREELNWWIDCWIRYPLRSSNDKPEPIILVLEEV